MELIIGVDAVFLMGTDKSLEKMSLTGVKPEEQAQFKGLCYN